MTEINNVPMIIYIFLPKIKKKQRTPEKTKLCFIELDSVVDFLVVHFLRLVQDFGGAVLQQLDRNVSSEMRGDLQQQRVNERVGGGDRGSLAALLLFVGPQELRLRRNVEIGLARGFRRLAAVVVESSSRQRQLFSVFGDPAVD